MSTHVATDKEIQESKIMGKEIEHEIGSRGSHNRAEKVVVSKASHTLVATLLDIFAILKSRRFLLTTKLDSLSIVRSLRLSFLPLAQSPCFAFSG